MNTASGAGALYSNTTALNNTAMGYGALYYNCYNVPSGCTAQNNTAVGYYAGVPSITANANITGANNTFIGYLSGPGTSTPINNATAIGYNALVSASNALVLGGTGPNAVNVGIGTTAPAVPLDVVGDISGSGKVTAGSLAVDTSTLVVDATNDRVGVGTASPQRPLQVATGDAYVSNAGSGIILKSPNGSVCRRVTIDNTGTLVASAITCP
jgi:hypothetical protein